MDLVSIVIPAYNPGVYLLDAIASARNQTHCGIEIILINDGSDRSDSQRIIEQARGDADVYLSQPNSGLPAARNAGFRVARGRYLVPLDADDLILPGYVRAGLGVLAENPQAAFAYTAYKVFGTKRLLNEPGDYNLYRLLDCNFLSYAAVIRKGDWEDAGGYDESMRSGYEDWEFWLRLGSRSRFGAYVPQPLFQYRKHGPSLYDVAIGRHTEIIGYIRSRHPELYEYEARARIKRRWSPAVCLASPISPSPQSIQDIEIINPGGGRPLMERSAAAAFLVCESGSVDSHSAEIAALAVWSGRSNWRLPDGSVALSRQAAEVLSGGWGTATGAAPRTKNQEPRRLAGPLGMVLRHLENAELLSWEAWMKHPWNSTLRLVPLRLKNHINHAAGRSIFDLSFYLQFRPDSLLIENTVVQRLTYFPPESGGRFRVALVTPHLGPGGAEAVLLEIATTLRRERFEVLLLATHSRDRRWLERWRACVDHVYDLAMAVPAERATGAVFSIVANWRCDAILVQNSLYGYAALPHIRSELPDSRIVDLIHALDGQWDQIAVTSKVAALIDLRAVISDSVRHRLLESGIPRDRIRLVRNGVDLEKFRASRVPSDGVRQILFVGRLDAVKRPLLLAKIAARLAMLRSARDFRFIVVGDGPEGPALRRSVRKRGLESLFEFRGQVEDTAPLFAECDVCVLTSRAEGVPLVVLESLASARPIVASNVGAISEVVDSSCGVLIDGGTSEPQLFAAAIHHLLDRPELRASMGAAGRAKMEADHDLRRAHEAYLTLLCPDSRGEHSETAYRRPE
jgi:glycosyltransferase involved in cell wall biosynthesis